jgi:membrane fusion protein, multidrug efflux system
MAKRMTLMLGAMLVLISALGFVKFKQVQSAVHASAFQPPPEAVTSVVAKREEWPATMAVIGTMEAVKGVTVSADLPGTVARIAFE